MAYEKVESKNLEATFVNYRVTQPKTPQKGEVVILKEGESLRGKFIKIKQSEGFTDQVWLLETKENGKNVINSISANASIKKGLANKGIQLNDHIEILFLRLQEVDKKGRQPYQVYVVSKLKEVSDVAQDDGLGGL